MAAMTPPHAPAWHFVQRGAGTAVVVLHGGMGLDHSYLCPAFDVVAGFARVLYVDLRGNGRTPPPASWDGFTFSDWARDLDAFRASLGIERWIVIGHSGGALVALEYALAFGEHTAGLVLVEGAASFEHAPLVIENAQRRGEPEVVAALLAAFSAPLPSDEAFARAWRTILPLYFHAWDARHRAAFAAVAYRAAAANQSLGLLPQFDVRRRLGEVSVPTLVVHGDDDFIMPAEVAGEPLVAGIAGAERLVVPACGHFPFLERPDVFFAGTCRFVQRLA